MAPPLRGTRIIELGGIGPGPHAAMLLADLGAEVVRIERPTGGLQIQGDAERDSVMRGRRSVAANLRDEQTLAQVLEAVNYADVLIDGFRPGVTERLGLGPAVALDRNPRLIYGRITGWGQEGPLSHTAGHDINYLALTGALHAIRVQGSRPTVPLNLVGDYGGGSMYLVVGILAALHERAQSGLGQVVDAAIVDGVSHLAQAIWSLLGQGQWSDMPASNLLDSGAPFYDTYGCADGRYVAVGALEPAFYRELLAGLNLAEDALPAQYDREAWPNLRAQFERAFSTRTRDEWAETFAGTDACVTPVLDFEEARAHPHLASRETLVERSGSTEAAPAPRFQRSVTSFPTPPPQTGSSRLQSVLDDWSRVD